MSKRKKMLEEQWDTSKGHRCQLERIPIANSGAISAST
jgi:hypothetical protein